MAEFREEIADPTDQRPLTNELFHGIILKTNAAHLLIQPSLGSHYRHASGTTYKQNKAHTRHPPMRQLSRNHSLTQPVSFSFDAFPLSIPERYCCHRHVPALPMSLPFGACNPPSSLRLRLPAPLLLAARNPSLPCTLAGAAPCPAVPSTLNPPRRGLRLGGRDYIALSQ